MRETRTIQREREKEAIATHHSILNRSHLYGRSQPPYLKYNSPKKKRKNRWERLEKKLFNTGTIVVYSIRLGNWHQMTQVDSTRAWMYYIQLTIDPCTTIAPFLSLFIYMPVNHPSYYPIAFTLLGELMAIKSTSSSCRQ